MKELRDIVTQQSQKVQAPSMFEVPGEGRDRLCWLARISRGQALNQLLASDEDGDKKKKKKTG